jgi:Cys-rich repeat protein
MLGVLLAGCGAIEVRLFENISPTAPNDPLIDAGPRTPLLDSGVPDARAPAQPSCVTEECARCVARVECPGPEVCHPVSGLCEVLCEGPALTCPVGLRCAVATGVCAACVSDPDCISPGLSRCDSERGVCAECRSDADCSLAEPACDLQRGECTRCTDNVHCRAPLGVCNTTLQVCQECVLDSDCAAGERCLIEPGDDDEGPHCED